MEIELKTRSLSAELIVTSGNAKISEDIADIKKGRGHIPLDLIEHFVTIAREMHNYNKSGSDIEFVKIVYDAFLLDGERQSFYKLIKAELEAEQEVGNG
jgi:hypothetical protein